jgi:hypothetical protein
MTDDLLATEATWSPADFDIVEGDPDPCRVTVEASKNHWQTWFAQCECFKSRVVRDASFDLSPEHF